MNDESKMLNFFMNAPAAIAIVHGPQHVFTFANPLYQQIFGRDESELLNRSIRETQYNTYLIALHPEDKSGPTLL